LFVDRSDAGTRLAEKLLSVREEAKEKNQPSHFQGYSFLSKECPEEARIAEHEERGKRFLVYSPAV
jgi:hypothetical protein